MPLSPSQFFDQLPRHRYLHHDSLCPLKEVLQGVFEGVLASVLASVRGDYRATEGVEGLPRHRYPHRGNHAVCRLL